MRASLETIGRINAYLSGELTAEQRTTFESSLAGNPELQQQLTFQQQLIKAVERNALRRQIETVAKQSGSNGFSWKIFLIAGLIVLGAIAGYTLFRQEKQQKQQRQNKSTVATPRPSANKPAATGSTGAAPRPISVMNRGDITEHDRFPDNIREWQPWVPFQRQYYSFDAASGSTIEGKDGTLIIVPAGAFLDASGQPVSGKVDFELIEAIAFADMIAYNLTTMSDGKALSSGGMLHIEARANGQELSVNPNRPLYIEIPTDNYNPDMMAWKGEENGETLNWTNPQPLKKYLAIVDFDQLDFLPEGFAGKVTTCLPFRGHQTNSQKLTDSLYYALGSYHQSENLNISEKSTVEEIDTAPQKVTSDERFSLSIPGLKSDNKSTFRGAVGELVDPNGNKLAGVQVLGGSGNSLFSNEQGRFRVDEMMLSREQLLFFQPGFDTLRVGKLDFKPQETTTIVLDFKPAKTENRCFIDPAGIRAIRTEKFEQTFLATKEFEERLRCMHRLEKGQEILDLYIGNLSKDLSEVDAMAVQLLTGADKAQFEAFARQGLTNVQEAPLYDEQLSAYYTEKREAFARETAEARKAYEQKSLTDLRQLQEDWTALSAAIAVDGKAVTSNVSKTSGKTRLFSLPKASVANTQSYATPWFSTGWMNIDCYLHVLQKGTSKDVSINTHSATGKVYQCLDLLQTIIPLSFTGEMATAKFPDPRLPESHKMRTTFCVGIDRNGETVRYAEQRYNPYATDVINLNWETVSAEQLYQRLQQLSPANDPLLKSLKEEEDEISKRIAVLNEQERIQKEMANIREQHARNAAVMNRLLQFVSRCNSESGNDGVPIEETEGIGI